MSNLAIPSLAALIISGGGVTTTYVGYKTDFDKQHEASDDDDELLNEYEEVNPEKAKEYESKFSTPYRGKLGVTHKKKFDLQLAKEKVKVLKDYSVLLAGCGAGGTGGILDYVLPDASKGQKYPTRGFIGTGAHVATHFAFDVKNPYRQPLPKWDGKCSTTNDDYGIVLGKEKPNVSKKNFNGKKFTDNVELIGQLKGKDPKYELENKRNESTNRIKNEDKWWFGSKNPKLVYAPLDYLRKHQKNYSKYQYHRHDYAVDFAVFEVDFEDEKLARLFTRNFYRKYNHVDGKKRGKALDFFAKPVADKYTNKQLLEKDIQVFGVGYPSRGVSDNATSNYNIEFKEASRFSYYGLDSENSKSAIKDENGEHRLGHVDMWVVSGEGTDTNTMGKGADRTMHTRGYGYVLEENALAPGASGGLFVTEDGDALGTLSFRHTGTNQTFISALRNKEFKDKDGNVLYPAYDLLEGVEDQMISYKSQIQTYVMSQCYETELSRLREWKNTMDYGINGRKCTKTANSSSVNNNLIIRKPYKAN